MLLLVIAAGPAAASDEEPPPPAPPAPAEEPSAEEPSTEEPSAEEPTADELDRLMEDAVALYRSGDARGALEILDRALAAYRSRGDRENESQALYARGIVRAKQRRHREALEDFEQALAIEREDGDEKDEAIVLREVALTYVDLRDFPKATETYEALLPLLVATEDREGEGEARHNLASLYSVQGQGQQAVEQLTRALAIRRELGDRAGEAGTLDNLGQVHEQLGRREEALELYRQALVIRRQIGDLAGADETQRRIAALGARDDRPKPAPSRKQRERSAKAHEYNNLASALHLRGELAAAQVAAERAIELFRKAEDRAGEGMALGSLAVVLIARGEHAAALELQQRALTLARETRDRNGEANALNNLGLIYLLQGEYREALGFFERARVAWREVFDPAAELRTIVNIAAASAALGDYAGAEESFREALTRQRGRDRAGTLLNLGGVQALQKKFPQALESLQEALARQRQLGDPLVSTTLSNLAALHAEMGEHARALTLLQEAQALDRQAGRRISEAGHLANIAGIHSLQGEHETALELYSQALAIARELGMPRTESHVLAGLGRVHQEQGRLAEALDFYLRSIDIEEGLRGSGLGEELKIRFGEQSADLYRRAVPLLERLGRPAEAFDLAERARARAFLDQVGNERPAARPGADGAGIQEERELRLALAGLDHLLRQERARPRAQQDAARIRSLTDQLAGKRREYADLLSRLERSDPEYASLVSVAPAGLAEVQRLLAPDTTLLAYFVTDESTLAFVVGRESFQAIELPVSERDLAAAISDFRSFPTLGGPPSPVLERLYAWLVAPVRSALETPLVGIVPHDVLHLLPFSALRDGESWFGEERTLFLLPSASALPFIERKRKPAGGPVLALAQGRPAGLPALRHAEQEAEEIAALYGARALVGAAATESALRERAGDAGILHIAAHGQLNARSPIFSRIVLAPDGTLDREADGMLELREIYDLDLAQASLVVLSACQTQLGEHSRGDDLVGLNRAFLYAGAPTVVASLWSVDDRATAALMQSFHRGLKEGLGKAAALQAAQAETRLEFPDPFHWSAFVLTGDPR